jgi:pyruvate ferredoxin oxidoreductase delta subunit
VNELIKISPTVERYTEYEELDWVVSHGLGVDHTADLSTFARTLAQVGTVKGREAYYYMRYDDSPERNYIPMMYYNVFGKPGIPVVLHEEVEPVGEIFNAIVLFSSNFLLQKTSQRALLFDGAKKNAILVVNTSLSPDDVVNVVKKYNLAQDWFGKVVTVNAIKIDSAIAYPILGALASAWDVIDLDSVLAALELLDAEKKKDSVKKGYDMAKVKEVSIRAEETELAKRLRKEIEIPKFTGEPWKPEEYYMYQKAAAEAESYPLRIAAMPRWEVLLPGLIEFGPEPGKRNLGFTTPWRWQRPIIDEKKCTKCNTCALYCPENAIDFDSLKVDFNYCKGCGTCAAVCPPKAITMVPEIEYVEGLHDEVVLKRLEAREYGY